MSNAPESSPTGAAVITEDLVAKLGAMTGVSFPVERLPVIAQRLREMHELAADLDSVDITGFEPAIRFDPTWSDGGAK